MAQGIKSKQDYLTGLGLRYRESDGDSPSAWLGEEGNRISDMDRFDQSFDGYEQKYYSDTYLGGDSTGVGSLMDFDRIMQQMTQSNKDRGIGAVIDPARQEELLRAAGQGKFNHYSELGKYFNPTEMQGFNQWKQWSDEQNADMSFGDYLAMGTFALGAGALGGAAFGGWGGAGAGASEAAAAGTAAAEAGAGSSWLTGGLGANAGLGGVGTAGLGLTAPAATSAIGSLGGGLGLIAPSAAAAGTAAGGFGNFVSGLLGNVGAGDVVKAGLNYLISNNQADKLAQAGQDAAYNSNPLNAPQRQQYQQQLQQLLQNPETFYSTNPVVKGQLDLARQQFEANSAKMGVGGTQFNDYLKNVQNIASGTFNDQAELLSGLGGFGFPGGSGSQFAYQGASDAAKYGSEAFRGFGGIADKIFSGMNKMGQSNEFSLG